MALDGRDVVPGRGKRTRPGLGGRPLAGDTGMTSRGESLGLAGPRMVLLLAAAVGPASRAFAQVELHSVSGSFSADQFGTSIDALGDIDGDGVGDIVAGCYQSVGGLLSGYAYSVSGRTGEIIYVHAPSFSFSNFGRSVAGVGDINADGVPDIAIGAPGDGAFYIFSGADNTSMGPYSHPYGSVANFAVDIDGGGDVNGDGVDDFIVGVTGNNGPAGFVYAGGGGILYELPLAAGSGAVALLGDLTGDGKSEFCGAGPDGTSPRPVAVYSGHDGSLLYNALAATTSIDAVEAVGDVDADEIGDFAVVGGAAQVFSGANGQEIYSLGGARSICGMGDVDGDGVPDVGVGATSGLSGKLKIFSGALGTLLIEVVDPHGASQFGIEVAGPGDVNGDGIPDIAVGAPKFDNAMADVGRVAIWSPTECVAINYCEATPNTAGPGATMGCEGSLSIAENDLILSASGCPPGQVGLFFYGDYPVQIPFGDGYRCVAGLVTRFTQVRTINEAGQLLDRVDFSNPPFNSGPSAILPGSTWRFQAWYRDAVAVGFGWNLSDGLAVTFCR